MNLCKTVFLSALVLLNLTAISQATNKQTYFVVNKDTTFCEKLSFSADIQGFLKQMNYTTLKGEKVELKGNKKVLNVSTFCINDSISEKLPLTLNKPNSYIRYTYKVVDGKLGVYIQQQGTSFRGDATGIYRFFIKMPDGKLYKINNNKNKKEIIIPYLLQCEKFKQGYKGDLKFNRNRFVNEDNFIAMIKFYNSVCD